MVKSIIPCCMIAVLLFGAAAADAGGHHGKASVCEDAGLIGAAYAACNVYCEALDCDGDDPSGSDRACEQALNRFQDLTDGGLPPCVASEAPMCPCGGAWTTEAFFPDDPTFVECMQEGDGVTVGHMHVLLGDDANGSSGWASVDFNNVTDMEGPYNWIACFSEHQPWEPGDPETGGFEMTNTFYPVPPEFDRMRNEIYSACESILLDMVQDLGIECEDYRQPSN